MKLQAKTKEQQKHVLGLLEGDSHLSVIQYDEDGVYLDDYITFEQMSSIVDYLREPKQNVKEFVDRMYKLYPTRCPVRNISLGKCSKDKERIKRLLKTYSKEDIERVIKNEVNSKLGVHPLKNFSTFLNNFPDPSETFSDENESASASQREEMLLKRFYETLSYEEEARIYGLVPSAFYSLTDEQKNWWRKEKKPLMLEWIRSHAD